MNPNEASYTLIDYYVQNFREALDGVFKKNKVTAPVTTENVINASIALKETPLNKDIAKAVGYSGETSSYDGDDFGGKILGFAMKAKGAINKVKAKVEDVKTKAAEKEKAKEEKVKEEKVKEETKKVLGMNPYVFYSILIIVILAIIITIVKLSK